MEVALFHDFISEAERLELLKWSDEMLPHLNPNGKGRAFKKAGLLPYRPPAFEAARLRLQRVLPFKEIVREPMFGWYLSSIGEGGAVHQHMDPAPPGHRHLRCNVFVQLPDEGGFPIIDGRVQPVAERCFLCFFPSSLMHGSQPVAGPRRRVLCSYGYLVKEDFRLPTLPDGPVQPEPPYRAVV